MVISCWHTGVTSGINGGILSRMPPFSCTILHQTSRIYLNSNRTDGFINVVIFLMSSIWLLLLDMVANFLYLCIMSVTEKIQKKITQINEGVTFTYAQLNIEAEEYVAAAKAIERLIQKNLIKRVAKGMFYKSRKTVFGELEPNEAELLKSYLFEGGKRIAYVTGTALYNRMGLTTQVPKIIKVASRDKRITISKGNLKAVAVKSYVGVNDKNFYLLEVLDAIKDFKRIPDKDKKSVIKIYCNKLIQLDGNEMKLLIKYSLSYPPRVRALLGALLENLSIADDLSVLRKSLNPLSDYEFGIDKSLLSNAENWYIK